MSKSHTPVADVEAQPSSLDDDNADSGETASNRGSSQSPDRVPNDEDPHSMFSSLASLDHGMSNGSKICAIFKKPGLTMLLGSPPRDFRNRLKGLVHLQNKTLKKPSGISYSHRVEPKIRSCKL